MTREEAFEFYCRRWPRVEMTIEKLMNWDESLTIEENEKAGGFKSKYHADNFQQMYKLKYKRVSGIGAVRDDMQRIRGLMALGCTTNQIAMLYKVKVADIELELSLHKLEEIRGENNLVTA